MGDEYSQDFARLLRAVRKGERDKRLEGRIAGYLNAEEKPVLIRKKVGAVTELILASDEWEFECVEDAIREKVAALGKAEGAGREKAKAKLEFLIGARERFFKRAESLASFEKGAAREEAGAQEAESGKLKAEERE